MKIFVCEFITGGGLSGESLPASLAQEGSLMRDALLRDIAQLEQLSIIVCYDQRLPVPALRPFYADEAVAIGAQDDAWTTWQDCIDRSDMVWIIAPETHGLLSKLSRLVLERNKLLIGSTLSAVALTSSKYATCQRLQQAGINTIPTYRFQTWLDTYSLLANSVPTAWVAKQDDGAGAEDSGYFENTAALCRWMHTRHATHVIQPYQPGHAASISLLCKHGRAWLLSCNTQRISLQKHQSQAGRFSYTGSLVNGMAQHWQAFAQIAQQVAAAVPGLTGYVGIDLIVEEMESGDIKNLHVLEINPRLTSSYAGLHVAMGYNPAKLVLELLVDELEHRLNSTSDRYTSATDKHSGGSHSGFVMPAILRLPVEVVLHA